MIATHQPSRPLAYSALSLAVLAASSAAILFKLAPVSAAAPLTVAFYRLGFAAALLAGPVLWRWDKTVARLSRSDLTLCVLSGVMLSLHFAAWFTSLNLTSVATSTVLVSTHPFIVMAISLIAWKERTSARAVTGVAVAMIGMTIVGWGDYTFQQNALAGDVLAVAGAAALAGYLLIGRSVRQQVDVLTYSMIAYASAALLLGFSAVLLGQPLTALSPADWMVFGLLALIPTILGHTLMNWALRYLAASTISVSILGEPLAASVLAWIIWRQIPPPISLGGGLLILLGILVFVRTQSRRFPSPGECPSPAPIALPNPHVLSRFARKPRGNQL